MQISRQGVNIYIKYLQSSSSEFKHIKVTDIQPQCSRKENKFHLFPFSVFFQQLTRKHFFLPVTITEQLASTPHAICRCSLLLGYSKEAENSTSGSFLTTRLKCTMLLVLLLVLFTCKDNISFDGTQLGCRVNSWLYCQCWFS